MAQTIGEIEPLENVEMAIVNLEQQRAGGGTLTGISGKMSGQVDPLENVEISSAKLEQQTAGETTPTGSSNETKKRSGKKNVKGCHYHSTITPPEMLKSLFGIKMSVGIFTTSPRCYNAFSIESI